MTQTPNTERLAQLTKEFKELAATTTERLAQLTKEFTVLAATTTPKPTSDASLVNPKHHVQSEPEIEPTWDYLRSREHYLLDLFASDR